MFALKKLSQDNKTMIAVFFIILVAFVGFSIPHIVFGPLFLTSDLFSADTPYVTRSFLLGVAIAVFPAGQVISLPLLGKLSDSFGRKKILLITLVVAIFGISITTFGVMYSSVNSIIIGRFITGLAEGNIAIAQAIVSSSENKELKEKRFAYITIAVNMGFVIGPLLGGFVSKLSFSVFSPYAMPFLLAVLMYVFCLFIVFAYIPKDKKATNKLQRSSIGKSLTNVRLLVSKRLRVSYLITFFTNVGIYSMFLFYTVLLVKEFNFSVLGLSVASALLSIPLIVSSLIISKVNASNNTKLLLGCIMLIIGLIAYGFSKNYVSLILSATIASFGISFLQVVTSLIVSNRAPLSHQGQVLGIYRAIVVFAEIAISLLGGVLVAYFTPLPFIVGAVCCIAVILYIIVSSNKTKQNQQKYQQT